MPSTAARDHGPTGKPFEHLDELGLVLGMTPELLARVTPYLTLYHEGEPDVREAAPPVLQALRETTGAVPIAPSGPPDETTVTITSLASGGNGGRFTRRAVVRLTGRTGGEGLYTILDWLGPDP